MEFDGGIGMSCGKSQNGFGGGSGALGVMMGMSSPCPSAHVHENKLQNIYLFECMLSFCLPSARNRTHWSIFNHSYCHNMMIKLIV